jgi:cation transport ATPase
VKPLHRRFLYFVVALLFLSGAAWTYWNYFVASHADSEMTAKAWAMKIHGGAAMTILVLIGMLLTGHVRSAWRARRNRGNGLTLLSALAVLTITGYGLYYAGDEKLRAWASWIHLGAGLMLPFLLILHIWHGRRTSNVVLPKKRTRSDVKIGAV